MTHDDIIRMALEAGFEKYEPWSLHGADELDRTLQVGEYPVGIPVFKFAEMVAAAERNDAQSYIDRLVAERDSLAEELEYATDRVEADQVMTRFISIATPELLAALPLSGRKVWRDKGFSRAQAKVMVILGGIAAVMGWKG